MENTFSYSREEGQQIITTSSLLDDLPGGELPRGDLHKVFKDLRQLLEKDTRLHLNSVTLSDYWRKGYIPRGLRIKKFPANVGDDKKHFRDRWEAILNKCSSDLMLLLIEESNKDREELKKQITEARKIIEEHSATTIKQQLEEKLNTDLMKYTQYIKDEKIQKFQRDITDYNEGKVYNWNKRPQRVADGGLSTKARPRTVSFNFSSSEEDDNTMASAPETTQEDFLEHPTYPNRGGSTWRRGRGRSRGRDRGRGRGGRGHGGAEGDEEPRRTRSRTRHIP